jgi:hypothetical protein
MGKYLPSKINNIYSDWHYQVLGKKLQGMNCYLCDVDRLWIEVRNKTGEMRLVAVMDIKEPYNTTTDTEKAVYGWFIKQEIPVYIVHTNKQLSWFSVEDWKTKEITKFSGQEEYGNWIKSL